VLAVVNNWFGSKQVGTVENVVPAVENGPLVALNLLIINPGIANIYP
jgi:hypothetical protein